MGLKEIAAMMGDAVKQIQQHRQSSAFRPVLFEKFAQRPILGPTSVPVSGTRAAIEDSDVFHFI